jgi:hypothetical protein
MELAPKVLDARTDPLMNPQVPALWRVLVDRDRGLPKPSAAAGR